MTYRTMNLIKFIHGLISHHLITTSLTLDLILQMSPGSQASLVFHPSQMLMNDILLYAPSHTGRVPCMIEGIFGWTDAKEEILIVNNSSHSLTTEEKQVLQLGLGFVPKPRYNAFCTRVDLHKFVCNIKLRDMFGIRDQQPQQFRLKSSFIPPSFNPSITLFHQLVICDLDKLEKRSPRTQDNLTKSQHACLNDLSNDTNIIIKPADKGGGIVIMSRL